MPGQMTGQMTEPMPVHMTGQMAGPMPGQMPVPMRTLTPGPMSTSMPGSNWYYPTQYMVTPPYCWNQDVSKRKMKKETKKFTSSKSEGNDEELPNRRKDMVIECHKICLLI